MAEAIGYPDEAWLDETLHEAGRHLGHQQWGRDSSVFRYWRGTKVCGETVPRHA